MRPTTVDEADISVATGGGMRERQIKAASAAVLLISKQIGRNAALVVLWDAFERVAATTEQETMNRG